MRITEQAKRESRLKILEAAKRLFQAKGYDQATTRGIAREAGIATGTLFNYFPTKEAIVVTLVSEALTCARKTFAARQAEADAPLEEKLFAQIANELRQMRPYRTYITPLLETEFSPLMRAPANATGETLRVEHLESVHQLLQFHRIDGSAFATQLYWTLYTGVLAFWANDTSPKQEDTLALLDQSLNMYVGWLTTDTQQPGQSR